MIFNQFEQVIIRKIIYLNYSLRDLTTNGNQTNYGNKFWEKRKISKQFYLTSLKANNMILTKTMKFSKGKMEKIKNLKLFGNDLDHKNNEDLLKDFQIVLPKFNGKNVNLR